MTSRARNRLQTTGVKVYVETWLCTCSCYSDKGRKGRRIDILVCTDRAAVPLRACAYPAFMLPFCVVVHGLTSAGSCWDNQHHKPLYSFYFVCSRSTIFFLKVIFSVCFFLPKEHFWFKHVNLKICQTHHVKPLRLFLMVWFNFLICIFIDWVLFCFLSHRRKRWQWQSHHSVSRVPHIWGHNRQGISQRADLPNECTQVNSTLTLFCTHKLDCRVCYSVLFLICNEIKSVWHFSIRGLHFVEMLTLLCQEMAVQASAQLLCSGCCGLMTQCVYQYCAQSLCTQGWTRGDKGEGWIPSFIHSSVKFSLILICLLFQMYQCCSLHIFSYFQPTFAVLDEC